MENRPVYSIDMQSGELSLANNKTKEYIAIFHYETEESMDLIEGEGPLIFNDTTEAIKEYFSARDFPNSLDKGYTVVIRKLTLLE